MMPLSIYASGEKTRAACAAGTFALIKSASCCFTQRATPEVASSRFVGEPSRLTMPKCPLSLPKNSSRNCQKSTPFAPWKIDSQHHVARSSGEAGGAKTRPEAILPTPSSACQKVFPAAAERVASILWARRGVISTLLGKPLHPHRSTSAAFCQSSNAIVSS